MRTVGIIFTSIITVLLILISISSSVLACSTFMLKHKDSFIVGHNVDYPSDYFPGYIYINKRDVAKTNFTLNELNGKISKTPRLTWVSKYGSVTFNCYIEIGATAGINEKGLFITEMNLPETKYPTSKSLPHMFANQWMQYQLDNYQSVKEILDNISKIVPESDAPNHYFISDNRGDCACIEYIHGRPVIYRGKSMPIPLLCNSKYSHEMKLLKNYKGFGGQKSINKPIKRTDTRFVEGAYMIKEYPVNPSKPIVDYGFDILTKMWRGNNKWAFIIDVRNSMVYFHTSRSRQMKYFSYQDVDFSANTPVKMFDVNSNTSGDVLNQFSSYTSHLTKYLLIERLKQDNPQVYNDQTRANIDALVKRIDNFLDIRTHRKEFPFQNSLTLKRVEAQKVISIRDHVVSSDEQVKLWNELIDFLIKERVATNGPGFTIYYGNDLQGLDLEVVIPVINMGSGSERVKYKILNNVDKMASVHYKGPHLGLPQAYSAIHRWITENNYKIIGHNREIWLRSNSDEKDPNEWLTEIQIPVKKK